MTEDHHPLVQAAIARAHDVASAERHVVLLHCATEEGHRAVWPDQPDHALQQRIDRAIAEVLVGGGCDVAVQRVDPQAWRGWIGEHPSGPSWRVYFRDPATLLRGPAALELLGVTPPPGPARKARPEARGGGTPADRLVRHWLDPKAYDAFADLLDELLEARRDGVIDMAIRKIAERYDDDTLEDFTDSLAELAESRRTDVGTLHLMAVAVLMDATAGPAPDAAGLAAGLTEFAYVPPGARITFHAAWFDADELASLRPTALRQCLHDLAAGCSPDAIKPVDGPPADGAIALLGLLRAEGLVAWEMAAAMQEAVEMEDKVFEETPAFDLVDPSADARQAAFDRWRDAALEANPALVDILAPVAPSELIDTMEEAAGEDGDDADAVVGDLDADDTLEFLDGAFDEEELEDFVEMAQAEAPGESLVGVPSVEDDAAMLSLYTRSGRLLDRRAFGPALDGAVPPALLARLAELVEVSDSRPQRC